MSTLAHRLTEALARIPGAKQADLARACGVRNPSVSDWFSGRTKELKSESYRRAAQFLGCRREWLETGVGDPGWTNTQHANEGPAIYLVAHQKSHPELETLPIAAVQVPVIGTLEMGVSKMFALKTGPDGHTIGTVPAFSRRPGSYAVRIFGDDLYPAVRHGACLVIEPNGSCHDGELVLVETDEGYYLVCELVALRDDALTYVPAQGGARRTLSRDKVMAVHPVVDITAASRFVPDLSGTASAP